MSYDPTLPPEPGYNQFRTTNQIYMQYPDVMDWHTGIVATASKHTHTRQRNA